MNKILFALSVLCIVPSYSVAAQSAPLPSDNPSAWLSWFKSGRPTREKVLEARQFIASKWRCIRHGQGCNARQRRALRALASAIGTALAAGVIYGAYSMAKSPEQKDADLGGAGATGSTADSASAGSQSSGASFGSASVSGDRNTRARPSDVDCDDLNANMDGFLKGTRDTLSGDGTKPFTRPAVANRFSELAENQPIADDIKLAFAQELAKAKDEGRSFEVTTEGRLQSAVESLTGRASSAKGSFDRDHALYARCVDRKINTIEGEIDTVRDVALSKLRSEDIAKIRYIRNVAKALVEILRIELYILATSYIHSGL